MSQEEHIVVKTSKGSLRGRKMSSVRGASFFGFQGIPYAKAPIGPLRFQPPVEVEAWTGIKDALKEGPISPSVDIKTGKYDERSNEDCLNLNVYTPKIPEKNTEAKKPVLFWIHGGGFCSGSGNTDLYSPDYLIVEDVVLVTCNYRLGPLGFLSLQTAEVPGNNGLKDIILALKWCQTNISVFGGDPKNVTIFGESAGAIAIHYFLLSKKTEGLFHKAIAQSGAAFIPMACATRHRDFAYKLAELLGYKVNNDKDLMKVLMNASAKDLALQSLKVLRLVETNEHFGDLAFVPCVEPENETALITKSPQELHKTGQLQKIPFMLGVDTLEGLFSYKKRKPEYDVLNTEKQMECLIPNMWGILPGSKKAREIAQKIKQHYFPKGPDEMAYIQALSRIYHLNGINQVIEYQSKINAPSGPTFVYRFSFDGNIYNLKHMLGFKHLKGTCHGDELVYLFKPTIFDSTIPKGSKDWAVMEKLTKIWTDFAKKGHPMPEKPNSWPFITNISLPYMDLGEVSTLKSDLEKSEYDFWKDLYKIACSEEETQQAL